MPLSWNEIKSRALTFSRTWADATHEDSQGKPFGAEMLMCFPDAKAAGVMDFVTAWYCKASDYIAESYIRAAFVSTNSITQGEQIGILWCALLSRRMLHIHFAHRTFRWTNEASGKASVYCVIIGFGVTRKAAGIT